MKLEKRIIQRNKTNRKNNKKKNGTLNVQLGEKPLSSRIRKITIIIIILAVIIIAISIHDKININIQKDEIIEEKVIEDEETEDTKEEREITEQDTDNVTAEQTEQTETEQQEQIEEQEQETVDNIEKEATQTVSRSNNTNSLRGYKMTSYYAGDGYSSSTVTGSGKKISDFGTAQVEGKTVYTYNGDIVVATATKELLKTGYSVNGSQAKQDKHYFSYYDRIKIVINGNVYNAVVLDSCGAAMWQGEYRIDVFVPNAQNVINANNVTILY